MTERVKDRDSMVRRMAPRLLPGRLAFRTVPEGPELDRLLPGARAMMREAEGVSLLLPAGAEDALPMCQITLDVPSALDGVGLTAAVAGALAAADIPCNMVAGHHHDHVFVPEGLADAALQVLRGLAAGTESQAKNGEHDVCTR